MTALMYAARAGHANIVNLLIECKARIDNEDQVKSTSFLHFSSFSNGDVANFLFL